MINTVLGPIRPEELGRTYIHEHLYVAPDELRRYYAYTLDIPDRSVDEARLFKEVGGGTLVDMTPLAYGRNIEALRYISLRSGVNVICVTGFHKDLWLPRWFDQLSDEEIAAEVVHEVEEGVGHSKVIPGAMKLGTSLGKVTDRERRAFAIAAPIALAHHLPIITHCDQGTMGNEQLDLLEMYGVGPDHVCLSHVDLTLDIDYLKGLCDRGASLSFDHVGRDLPGRDHERVDIIAELVGSGYGDKICLAGDMGKKDYLRSYGGSPGLGYILTDLRDRLLERICAEDFERMVVDNPRHVLD